MNRKARNNSRRQFLKDSGRAGLMLAAFDTIFASVLQSHRGAAWAQSCTGGGFKSFIHLNMYGAPPRWMYDLFLNPTNDPDLFMRNPYMFTRFTGNTYTPGSVEFAQVKPSNSSIWVPHLWKFDVPSTSGTLPASNLLQNMLTIRGIDALNGGHVGANQFHQSAVVGSQTIAAVLADKVMAPAGSPTHQGMMRAVSLSPSPGTIFKSKSGFSPFRRDVRAEYTAGVANNELLPMFNSFIPISSNTKFSSDFISSFGALSGKVNDALKQLSPPSEAYYKSLLDSSDKAFSLVKATSAGIFADLDKDWTGLFNKYLNLVNQTLKKAGGYEGINDKAIPIPTTPDVRFQLALNIFPSASQSDLRALLTTAKLDTLAAQFAVMEYLAVRKITPSIVCSPATLENLNTSVGPQNLGFDQHQVGSMPATLLTSMYYLGFTACMLEFIRALKSAPGGDLFADTLIYMGSEFNRSPRKDGSGSDHGVQGASVSLLSGRIQKFKVVGNILKNAAGQGSTLDDEYHGTWGYGAPIGGAPLSIVQFWGSIMTLLGASDLPNAVDKSKLIFTCEGDPTIHPNFDSLQTVKNASRA